MRLSQLTGTLGVLADSLRTQRTRTLLTVMGIAWGTTAVVVLLSFGSGFGKRMRMNAAGIGDGVVILFPGTTALPWAGFPEGRSIRLQEEDVTLLRREARSLDVVTPEYGRWNVPVRNGERVANPYVTGVEPAYGDLRNVIPVPGGRFIDAPDLEGRRRVAFLGFELKELLFGDADAVGRQVTIGGTPFTVVGVLAEKTQNSSYSSRDEDRVFIPATTYRSIFGSRFVDRILFRPDDPDVSAAAVTEARETLARRHRFDPADEDAVGAWDTNDMMRMFKYLFLGFNVFLGIVGSFTLVVGGIGVANIMYVVVRERTREIGVRRALGAPRSAILLQILLEALVIVAAGAALGMTISLLLVAGIGALPIEEQVGTPELSPLVLGTTMALLGVVALLAGVFPARRAAALDPVEALRYGA